MLPLQDYRKLRELAFVTTRQRLLRLQSRPTFSSCKRLVRYNIHAAMRELNLYLAPFAADKLSENLAKSISTKWDSAKARRPPLRSRALRGVDLLQVAMDAGAKPTASRRALAGDSRKTSVQRAMVTHGLARPWEKKKLSPEARRLAAVLAGEVPIDGKRAFDLGQLCAAAFLDVQIASRVFEEISSAGVAMQLWTSGIPAYGVDPWVVAVRGRRKSAAVLQTWLRNAEERRRLPNRHPMRPDQRCFVVDPRPALIGPEYSDLYSVIAVREGTRSLTQWRRFVHASTSAHPEIEGTASLIDKEAIVTTIQSALRLDTDLQTVLGKAGHWVGDPGTRQTAEALLRVANFLIATAAFRTDALALREWADETGYLIGIQSGELPGRDFEVAEDILNEEEINVDEWVQWGESEFPDFLRQPLVESPKWVSSFDDQEEEDGDDEETASSEYLTPIEDD